MVEFFFGGGGGRGGVVEMGKYRLGREGLVMKV